MIGVGIFGLLVRGTPYIDNSPSAYHSSDYVIVRSEALVATQAKSNDWPLIVGRYFLVESERPPEIYQLSVGGVRHSSNIIRFDIDGESPKRTTALASWLADAAARSLRESLPATASGEEGSAIAEGQATEYSFPISRRWVGITADFLPSVLLVAAGVFIYRLRRYESQGS